MIFWVTKTKNNQEMESIKNRLKMLEDHRERCEIQHSEHSEHRRRLYDKIDEAIAYLKKISSTMEFIEQNKESITKSHNEYITKQTIKDWAGWVVIVGAAVTTIMTLIKIYG